MKAWPQDVGSNHNYGRCAYQKHNSKPCQEATSGCELNISHYSLSHTKDTYKSPFFITKFLLKSNQKTLGDSAVVAEWYLMNTTIQ